MGSQKDRLAQLEAQHDTLIDIALDAGLLRRCEVHDYVFWTGETDYTDAYKRGNLQMTCDAHFAAMFKNDRRAMTDALKAVIDEHNTDCIGCVAAADS
jgi:hypothetical protein